MSSFYEANQAKLSIKMLLSDYAWFRSSSVENQGDDYIVVVDISRIDNSIRKLIPIVHKDINIKTEVVGKIR
jgi:hypothetical protein